MREDTAVLLHLASLLPQDGSNAGGRTSLAEQLRVCLAEGADVCGICTQAPLDLRWGWRIGHDRYALVHLITELAAAYVVRLKAASALAPEEALALETRVRDAEGSG
jgi:hypothetical protein